MKINVCTCELRPRMLCIYDFTKKQIIIYDKEHTYATRVTKNMYNTILTQQRITKEIRTPNKITRIQV